MTPLQLAIGEMRNIVCGNITEDTLFYLVNLCREYRKNDIVRRTAENLINTVKEKNWDGEIKRIYEFVKNKMRYTRDINNVEMVKTPLRHLTDISQRGITFGDCDDASLLLATLLESVGYKCRFVIVRTAGNPLDTYNHIYVECMNPYTRVWTSLDATEKNRPYGWKPQALKTKLYNI